MIETNYSKLKTWYSENRRDVGKTLCCTALFLGALSLLLFMEYKMQAAEALGFKANLSLFPKLDQDLVDRVTTLATQLNIASQVLGYTSLALAIGSVVCLYGTKEKERPLKEKVAKVLEIAGTILTAIALTCSLLSWVHAQEVAAIKDSLGKLPLPGIDQITNDPEKLVHFYQIIGWCAGGTSLICKIASHCLHKEEDKTKKTLQALKSAALIFLFLTAVIAMQAAIHHQEALNLKDSFAIFPFPLPPITDLAGKLASLGSTLTYMSIVTGGLSLGTMAGHIALKKLRSKQPPQPQAALA